MSDDSIVFVDAFSLECIGSVGMGTTKELDFWNGNWDIILEVFPPWTWEFHRSFMMQGEIFILGDK